MPFNPDNTDGKGKPRDERRYRGGRSNVFPVWNGIFDHRRKMGGAIWVFLWCIDKITKEREGEGLLLRGKPIKLRKIADDLKYSSEKQIGRDLKRLKAGHYIRTRRTPYGLVIWVLNSRKLNIWKTKPPPEKPGNVPQRSHVMLSPPE